MKRTLLLVALVCVCAMGYSQEDLFYDTPNSAWSARVPLEEEFVCDFADWTPDSIQIKGSTQGMAMYRHYTVVVHDKGMCCIYDMKKKALVSAFMLEGNTSH
ncbi:MAG: hypothetical protein IJ855_07145 [Bacteroidales bacterium]|nr:hypothetical protein [Bacteroidales bacterium]